METTRHVTATVYLVNDGATALHRHKRHGITIPPGGHVDRAELPHEAGAREVREETGLDPTFLDEPEGVPGDGVRSLPEPRHHLLYDINTHGGEVGHQHVDLIYYATVDGREIRPDAGEADASDWGWYTAEELDAAAIDDDVAYLGREAIGAAERID